MRKVLIGLVAAAVLGVAGFFGFQAYVQHRIASELDAALEPVRAAGGKASHGRVSFDLLSRTARIADITSESAAQPPMRVKIASLTAQGASRPDTTRFAADSIEATDVDVEVGIGDQDAGQNAWTLSYAYKVPKLVIRNYSGPVSQPQPAAGATSIDTLRSALDAFAAVTASSITAPSIATKIGFGSAAGKQAIDYTYSNLSLAEIAQGKIGKVTVERASFAADLVQLDGKAEKYSGEIANIAVLDIDTGAMRAMLDPARANDDSYVRVYRQSSVGEYAATLKNGTRIRIDGITMDDVGLRPSKLQFAPLMGMMAAMSQPGKPPSPAQARDMMQKVAGIYQGLHTGNAEMRGIAMTMPEGSMKLAAARFNLNDGKIGEFALEGLDVGAPQGQVKLDRFAIKGFDIANLMRLTSQFITPGLAPSPNQLFGMLQLIDGAEIKGLVAPFKTTTKQIKVDTLSLDWGQFVGPIPTRAHLIAKLTTPIDATNPAQRPLIAAGLTTAAIDLDLGAAWSEASETFVLDPVKFDFGELLKATARVSLAHVPRGLFSPDLPQALAMATQIEAGALELTLHDDGGVDLAVTQFARAQSLSREAARRALVESIKAGAKANSDNADVLAAAEAIARLVENPRGTLTLKLTPLGKLPALQLVQLLKTDPMIALAQFRIEVSSDL